jgi:hypothetical protein
MDLMSHFQNSTGLLSNYIFFKYTKHPFCKLFLNLFLNLVLHIILWIFSILSGLLINVYI